MGRRQGPTIVIPQSVSGAEIRDDGSAMVTFVPSKPTCTIPTTFRESVENTDEPLAAPCVMMSTVNPWGRKVCLQNAKTF